MTDQRVKTEEEIKARAEEIVGRLTVEECAALLTGADDWHMPGLPGFGLAPVFMTDGPHGVRTMADEEGVTTKSTCYTALSTSVCSFDPELMTEVGRSVAEECLEYGVYMLLGPGCNIKRSPLCGRNFEYMSEDPLLAGKMAAGLVRGIQENGVSATVKHFACNNQEKYRMITDAIVDERALREIYLKPFEIAVREGHVKNVMCSYNKVNGTYMAENKKLLTEILRDDFGFDGVVVSDWGAMNDWTDSVEAGLDLAMPGGGLTTRTAKITEAVKAGRVSEEAVKKGAVRIVKALLRASKLEYKTYDRDAHNALVRKAAAESAVLLENKGILPLQKEQSFAVIGEFAKAPRYQGAGSSQTTPNRITSVCETLDARGIGYVYSEGVGAEQIKSDESKIAEAVKTAAEAGMAVVFAGLPASFESEAGDRNDITIPEAYRVLIDRLTEQQIPTVVVLMGGSSMDIPFRKKVDGLLYAGLTGQNNGEPICDILFGDVNPSGHLGETWPILEKQQPICGFGERDSKYTESIYVGYRYYDKAEDEVAYPFGYGLSYTDFSYTDLKITKEADRTADGRDAGRIIVTVTVTNTGARDGKEVVQVYVEAPETTLYKAKRELKGFAKVALATGESKEVTVTLPIDSLAYYNAEAGCWHVESGDYRICVCKNSREVILSDTIAVSGDASVKVPDYRTSAPEYYDLSHNPTVSEPSFAAVYGRAFPEPFQLYPLHINSTIGDVLKVGLIAKIYKKIEPKLVESMLSMGGLSEEDRANVDTEMAAGLVANVMDGLPLRNLAKLSDGKLTPDTTMKLVNVINFFNRKKA